MIFHALTNFLTISAYGRWCRRFRAKSWVARIMSQGLQVFRGVPVPGGWGYCRQDNVPGTAGMQEIYPMLNFELSVRH